MTKTIKIAVIGDFNFTFNAHHATNMAIEHSANLLGLTVSYYWIRTHEAVKLKPHKYQNYNGVIIAPGPYENAFFLQEIMKSVLSSQVALLITGETFKTFVEHVVQMYKLNPLVEKVISDNLVNEHQFEKLEVEPVSAPMIELYGGEKRIELSNARFSIYPQIFEVLEKEVMDVEAINQFNEPEIVSLKSRAFCVASMSLPQVCSIQEAPHPLISGFINFASQWEKGREVKLGK